jgi:hypothetical protein
VLNNLCNESLNNIQPTNLLTWTDSSWFIGFKVLTVVVMKIALFIIHGVFWSLNVAPTKLTPHTPARSLGTPSLPYGEDGEL